jgi:Flp pilus assembly protein CpaB
MSIALGTAPAGGFITPGSRIDIVASRQTGNKVAAFLLTMDVLVVAVETRNDPNGRVAEMHTITLALTAEQAKLVTLALERGCQLDTLQRSPDVTANTEYDPNKVRELLETPPTAPAPRPKHNR